MTAAVIAAGGSWWLVASLALAQLLAGTVRYRDQQAPGRVR